VAAQAGAQGPAPGVRGGHARALRRRGGQPPRPCRRRSRPAVDAPVRAAAPHRRRGVRGDRSLGRLVGRRPGHRQRAARPPAHLARGVPRGRRKRPPRAPGAPLLGAHRGGGPAHRPRAVAHERLPATGLLGSRDARAVRGARQGVTPDDVRKTVLVSADLGRHVQWLHELAGLGFDEIALHHVGQDLDPFIDAFGDHVLPALR